MISDHESEVFFPVSPDQKYIKFISKIYLSWNEHQNVVLRGIILYNIINYK